MNQWWSRRSWCFPPVVLPVPPTVAQRRIEVAIAQMQAQLDRMEARQPTVENLLRALDRSRRKKFIPTK